MGFILKFQFLVPYVEVVNDDLLKCYSMFHLLNHLVFPMNLQIAEIIKEDLWPNPLKYFNNVILFIIICSFLFFCGFFFCFICVVTQ